MRFKFFFFFLNSFLLFIYTKFLCCFFTLLIFMLLIWLNIRLQKKRDFWQKIRHKKREWKRKNNNIDRKMIEMNCVGDFLDCCYIYSSNFLFIFSLFIGNSWIASSIHQNGSIVKKGTIILLCTGKFVWAYCGLNSFCSSSLTS